VRDPEPSIYLYDQQYPLADGSMVVRKGFIALTRIEDFSTGVVKPHEKTLAGPKADRLLLTQACGANFSPIFSLYADPSCALESLTQRLKEKEPDVEVRDDDGVLHRLWQIAEQDVIKKAQGLLDSKPLFIADGHHRYETALNYRNQMREKHPDFTGKELFNYVLMYFANMEDQGMLIFPTHRLIHSLPSFDLDSFIGQLSSHFDLDARPFASEDKGARQEMQRLLLEKGKERHTLAFFAGGPSFYFLSLRDEQSMDALFEARTPKALRTLDVSILHRLVLETMLGISVAAQEQQTNLRYVKSWDDAIDAVLAGEAQISFLMNATRMSEVRDVANAGEKMPQKSTYFYPKLLSGLVINRIVEGEKVAE
jgi:uncharacterized protein (DUF1015 family)